MADLWHWGLGCVGVVVFAVEPGGFASYSGPNLAFVLSSGIAGEGAGPGDVAVTGGIESVAAFGESPARTVVGLAQREIVGSDVLFGAGEPFFGDGKLVHQRESKVVFEAGEIDL